MEPADRERLLDALLVELGEKGYREMALANPLRLCGVSKTAFEAELVDKDTALFAAYGQLTERLRSRVTGACAGADGAWGQRVHAGLQALLDELAANPQTALVLIRTFPAISRDARARYQEFVEEFAPMLREGRELSERGEELPAEVEMFAVGAAETIVFGEIDAGRASALPALGPSILFSVLVPFLGPEAASAEMETAKQLS
jgi:AcrR family transcriptional regulator